MITKTKSYKIIEEISIEKKKRREEKLSERP